MDAPIRTEQAGSQAGGRTDSLRQWVDASVAPVVDSVRQALIDRQASDGHWLFELEADATIPAEYILYGHYLDEIDRDAEPKLASYLRSIQGSHGGWPLFHDGDFDISASVKAYYALKLAGDSTEAPHMVRARNAILAHGGAAHANVFTRIALALFGQVPWRAVPVMPVEIMLLPRWFPFHMTKVSYWSRTVIAPLLVLMALKPRARNPLGIGISELFVTPPEAERHYMRNPTGSAWGAFFLGVDRILRVIEPLFPRALRTRAIKTAIAFVTERLNGEDGLGAIFPAMVNSVLAFEALGYPKEHPDLVIAKRSIKKLLTSNGQRDYCQPCVSPIWDTGLAAHAMLEAGEAPNGPVMNSALDWLVGRQILDVKGDWAVRAPDLRPGGWAFQYWNDHYPDVDDTAVVAMALDRAGDPRYRPSIERAKEWIIGMQSRNGGWGAFDIDNTHDLLNNIPFADHGALLDPPTADVSARCVSMLAQLGLDRNHPAMARGLAYLRREQEADGSWFGRWGTNYIYGTWSVLCALNIAGEDMGAPYVRKAVDWLIARQRADGGWGEDGATYWADRRGECKASTPSHTAWALLGLMAAGVVEHDAVRRGVDYLLNAPRTDGRWHERYYNAVGFPRVFYLLYHGYAAYFPLWALARFRNLVRGNAKAVAFGM
ncbi:MAG: squalene--hopene cyclase [Alphaproteobacteria bacterium]